MTTEPAESTATPDPGETDSDTEAPTESGTATEPASADPATEPPVTPTQKPTEKNPKGEGLSPLAAVLIALAVIAVLAGAAVMVWFILKKKRTEN